MLDRKNFLSIDLARGLQRDRGAGVELFAAEQFAARHDEMDAGAADTGQGGDGTFEFALERADIVDILQEIGRPEAFALVEQLVADGTAGGQSLLGEHQAQPGHLVLRREDLGAVAADLVGNVHLLELRDDGARVLLFQLAVERRQVRGGEPRGDEDRRGQQDGDGDADDEELAGTEPPENLSE